MENEIITMLNQVLNQIESLPAERTWLETWAPSLSAIIGIIVTAYLSYILGYKSQIKLADRKLRLQAYGKLMGSKHYLSQLYVSRFEAYIFSDYHEKKWLMTGAKENSIDFTEAKRWMLKSEELVLEISKYQEKVFSTLGVVNAVFDSSDELTDMVNKIYKFKRPIINKVPDNISIDDLKDWKEQATTQVQNIVEQEISTPIQNLLEYLNSKDF